MMTLKTRRILYVFTILLFVFGAPALFLYAVGYRYDPSTGSIIKTGGIYIKTIPAESHISINGNEKTITSPARIRFLWPGNAQVTITSNGYYPVHTEIEIKEGGVTLLDPIELLPTASSKEEMLSGVSGIFASPVTGDSFLIFTHDGNQFVKILSSSNEANIYPFEGKVGLIQWTQDGATVSTDTGYYIFRFDSSSVLGPIKEIDSIGLSSDDPDVALISKNFRLYTYNLKDRSTTLLDVTGAGAYEQKNMRITAVGSHDSYRLKITERGSTTDLGIVRGFPVFSPLSRHMALMHTSAEDSLIDLDSKEMIPLSTVRSWQFASPVLYYATGTELWSIDVETRSKKLINRFNAPVHSVSVSPEKSGLLVSYGNQKTFWYLTTPSPTTIDLESENGGTTLFQRISNQEFREFSLDAEGNLSMRTFTM